MHYVPTDKEITRRAAYISALAGVIAALSIFVLSMEVSLVWKIPVFFVAIACGIVIYEFRFGLWNYTSLDSDELIELTEIAKRTPEVAQWASAAVRDGRTLRSNDLDVARATDRVCREARAQKTARAALLTALEDRQE